MYSKAEDDEKKYICGSFCDAVMKNMSLKNIANLDVKLYNQWKH